MYPGYMRLALCFQAPGGRCFPEILQSARKAAATFYIVDEFQHSPVGMEKLPRGAGLKKQPVQLSLQLSGAGYDKQEFGIDDARSEALESSRDISARSDLYVLADLHKVNDRLPLKGGQSRGCRPLRVSWGFCRNLLMRHA